MSLKQGSNVIRLAFFWEKKKSRQQFRMDKRWDKSVARKEKKKQEKECSNSPGRK